MQKKLQELEQEFNSNLNGGLTDEQVVKNRETYGVNQLEQKKKQIKLII